MSCGLDIGALDQRLTFQRRAPGHNAVGQAAGSWVEAFTCWGSAEPLRGREFFAAGQMQGEVTVRFRIRWRADVDETMRVLWDGVPYDISAPPINVKGQRVALELMCLGGVRNGA